MKTGSSLLIDETPLMVLPTLATHIGLNEAIFLQQVHYWLGSNRKARRADHYRDGRWWTYNTYEEWQKSSFPFWSISTIKRIVYSLEELGVLVSANYGTNVWDHTKWYSIDYDVLDDIITRSNLEQTIVSTCYDQPDQPDPILIKQRLTTEINTETVDISPSVQPAEEVLEEETIEEYFDKLQQGRPVSDEMTPRRTPDEMRREVLETMRKGAVLQYELEDAVRKSFHLNPNWDRKNWRELLVFLRERPPEETVERFAKWWYEEDWRGKQGGPPRPEQIVEFWPQAFLQRGTRPELRQDEDGGMYV